MGYGTHGELKFYDELNINFSSAPETTGTIWSSSLINIVQGTGESQRIGRKVTVSGIGLHWTANLQVQSEAQFASDTYRVILYQDKQTNGTAAVPSDLLEAPVSILSFRNLANSNRFRILYDKNFEINAKTGGETASVFTTGQITAIPKMWVATNVACEFSGTTGNISEIRSNNFGILVLSTNQRVTLFIQSRVRYTDM